MKSVAQLAETHAKKAKITNSKLEAALTKLEAAGKTVFTLEEWNALEIKENLRMHDYVQCGENKFFKPSGSKANSPARRVSPFGSLSATSKPPSIDAMEKNSKTPIKATTDVQPS